MAEDSQLLLATAKTYIKGAADLTKRQRLWLAMMESYGTFMFNASGHDRNWTVEYAQPELDSFGDGDSISYSNHRAYKQCSIDVRGYRMTDMITLKQQLMNRGETQIVNLMDKKLKNMVKGARDQFGKEIYIDGNTTANVNRFHGINSFMGAGTVAAGDRIAMPSDTYAGLSTALGTYGGSWSSDLAAAEQHNSTLATDWPDGNGKSQYDFFSPKLVNYSSTAWPSGSTAWRDNCVDVLRAIGIWCHCTLGDESSPMFHMMGANLFRDFKTAFDPTLRILVPHKASADLGFPDALDFEGMAIKHEFDCPAGEGYSVTPAAMEGFFMQDGIFDSKGSPWFDRNTQEYRMLLYCFGNFRWQPKYFAKFAAYA